MTTTLRTFLAGNLFWILELQFALVVVGFLLNARQLWERSRIDRAPAAAALAAAIVAALCAALVAPRTNRIYYDEQIYQNVGQQLADGHRAEMCNDGSVEYGRLMCRQGEYNKEPSGYPYLLSVGYRLAGAHEWVAFAFNNLCAFLSVLTVFVAALLLYEDTVAAAAAAWFQALIPHQLRWSNTAAAEPAAALMCAVAVVTALWFVRARTTAALIWMIAATTFATTMRPETPLVAIVVAAAIVLLAPDELGRRRIWIGAGAAAALALPTFAHLIAVRAEQWGAPGQMLSTAFFWPTLAVNGPFYLNNREFPAMVCVLALAGVADNRRWRAHIVPILHFVLMWGIFLFFYAGSYYYGADVRYSLMTYPPLAVAAGAGASSVLRRISRYESIGRLAPALLGLAIVWQFLWFMPLVRAVGEESWAARADVAVAREFAGLVAPDSVVLTHNPSMFLMWGRNAAQASVAVTDEPYVRQALLQRPGSHVYFHWNFWCNVDDPVQVGFCRKILDRYPMRLVAERRVRSYRFALYELVTPPPANPR